MARESRLNLGKMIKEARENKHWTRAQLADAYGCALREKPVSVEAIRMLEEYDKVPKSLKRRVVLAALLGIPLIQLGIPMNTNKALRKITVRPAKLTSLDIDKCTQRLEKYWKQHYTNTAGEAVEEIAEWLFALHDDLPYARKEDQSQILEMICGFRLILANILRDLRQIPAALDHLNKAYALSKSTHNNVLQSLVLFRRGWVYCDEESFELANNDFNEAHTLLTDSSKTPYGRVSSVKSIIPPQLSGSVLLGVGFTKMHMVQSERERTAALTFIDASEKYIDKGEDSYYLNFNPERYHLDRAAALLGPQEKKFRSPEKALEQLDAARKYNTSGFTRRGAYSQILEARAHIDKGYYGTAVELATDALVTVKAIKSEANIARISQIHTLLTTTNYRNELDVAELAVEIIKAQYPEVFL